MEVRLDLEELRTERSPVSDWRFHKREPWTFRLDAAYMLSCSISSQLLSYVLPLAASQRGYLQWRETHTIGKLLLILGGYRQGLKVML